jgi:pimeloyl-ACP methyl ester carboxylesterase
MPRAIRRPLDDVPVLVVHGADDPALGPQLLNGWEAALPRGEVHMLAPCSHWVQQDWPDQVNSLMADWFGRQGLPGRASQPGRQQQQQQAQASHKQ